MTRLGSILGEPGMDNPPIPPEPDIGPGWIVQQEFRPEQGKSYELAFGRILCGGEYRQVLKRVRIDGPTPNDWFDLDEDAPLDLELHDFPVKAFRLLA